MPSAAEVTHLLGAVVLALGFVLVARRTALVLCARAQSVATALAAGWQAWATASPALWGLAACVALAGAVALPWAMQRHGQDAAEAPPAAATLLGAAALSVLAMLAAELLALPQARENLGLALASVLTALLLLATRRAQLVGLHALANGVALAAVAVGASAAASLAVVALYGFVAVGFSLREPTA